MNEQKPLGAPDIISDSPDALVSAPPVEALAGHSIVSRESKVEFRDQDGNILDPEKVKEMEGKVSFKTRYETRTRLVDSQGNEIEQPVEQQEIPEVAPAHPEGVDASTDGVPEVQSQEAPATQQDVLEDERKEAAIEQSDAGAAQPGSEGSEATES